MSVSVASPLFSFSSSFISRFYYWMHISRYNITGHAIRSNLCDFAWMHSKTTTQMTLLIIICACVWVYYHFYQNTVNLWTCPYMRALLSSHYMMLFALTKQCNRMEICINLFFLPFAWLFVQYKVNFRWNEQWWWWTPVQSEIRIPFSNGPRNRCVGRLWKLPKFWTLFYIFM